MKVEHFSQVDGYDVFNNISEHTSDPEETKLAVQIRYPDKDLSVIPPDELERLFAENVRFSECPGTELIEDAFAAQLEAKTAALGEHEKLLADGSVIPDFRGTEYWEVQENRWRKTKVETLGTAIPAGAIQDKDLTAEQRQEIADQQEKDRVAKLSPDEKTKEKQDRIKAVLREAAIKKQEADIEAEISGESSVFDATAAIAWVQERKSEIEAKYA